MTHFLEVGSLREGIQEVLENTLWLRQLLAMSIEQRAALEKSRAAQGNVTTYADDVRTALSAIQEQAASLLTFLDQFESDPIIYTGQGSTAEVLAMLERLISPHSRSAGGGA